MRSKILAALSAVAIALGMVAFTATTASAHHNTITATATCNTATSEWNVVWSVTNSENNKTETIISSNHTDVVPVGTTFANGETKTFTQVVSAPTSITLTLKAEWSNGYMKENQGSISQSAFKGDCEPPPTPVSGNATAVNAVCSNGVVTKGYVQVAIKTGIVYTITKKNSTTAIAYNPTSGVTGPLEAGDYTVTAKAADNYTLNNPKSWNLTIASAGSCTPPPCLPNSAVSYTYDSATNSGIVTVTGDKDHSAELCNPFWVTAASWTFDTNTTWPQTLDQWNPANGGGKIDSVGTYPYAATVGCGQGDIYATFTSPGVVKPSTSPGALTGPNTGYAEHFLHKMGFTGPSPTYMQRDAGACNAVTAAATFQGYQCDEFAPLVLSGTHVTFTVRYDDANPVRSVANVAPGSYELLADFAAQTGDRYFGQVTVTAQADAGYALETGAKAAAMQSTWVFDATTPQNCPTEVKVVPVATFTDVCGIDNDTVNGVADTPEIDYTVTDDRTAGVGLVTVTAAAKAGYVFAAGAYAGPWTHSFTSEDCFVDTFGDPLAFDETCSFVDEGAKTSGYIWVDLEGNLDNELSYQIVGGAYNFTALKEVNNLPPGVYTVTATAKAGYQLDTTKESEWTFTIKEAGTCTLITHPLISTTATATNTTCSTGGTYTLADTEGVVWYVDGSKTPTAPGTYSVTGATTVNVIAETSGPDYGWEFDAKTSWTFNFTDPVDCLPTLAYTGSDGANLGLLLAGGFLLFGGTIVAFERRFRSSTR